MQNHSTVQRIICKYLSLSLLFFYCSIQYSISPFNLFRIPKRRRKKDFIYCATSQLNNFSAYLRVIITFKESGSCNYNTGEKKKVENWH